jgi:4-alpha-glucanotransferase
MASLQGGRVRLDHFNGVLRYWAIPEGATDATEGAWRPGPGAPLLKALQETLPAGALIAEDLGTETPGGDELRAEWDIPGMRVLQFGLGPDSAPIHHPHHVARDVGYYTSTHDSPPLEQWIRELSDPAREELIHLTGSANAWNVLECVWRSPADLVGAQIQDVLGLGKSHRMNVPGTATGNWAFALPRDALSGPWISRLADLNDAAGRSASR